LNKNKKKPSPVLVGGGKMVKARISFTTKTKGVNVKYLY